MLSSAIPRYRLPAKIVDGEIGLVKRAGVKFECGKAVSIAEVKKAGAEAVIVAAGAAADAKLGLAGEEKLCTGALALLRAAGSNRRPKLSGRVVVVGGGNVAIDAARTALRCGASEATVLYRRGRELMPAIPEEIAEAEEEGVKLELLAAPVRLVGKKKLSAVECVRMKLGKADASGRPRPEPRRNSNFEIKCDVLIPAVGQVIEAGPLGEDGLGLTGKGFIEADPETLATNVKGVFAAGDAVLGPATVAEAVGQGARAAESVELFLEGKDPAGDRVPDPLEKLEPREVITGEELPTRRVPELPDKRAKKPGFGEIRQGYDRRRARAEAARCLACGGCSSCGECGAKCIYFAIERRGHALLVDREKCDGCGLCAELCPRNAVAMLETGPRD